MRRTFGHEYTPKFRPPEHVEISVLRVAYATFISQQVINLKSFNVLISNQSFVPHIYIRARLPPQLSTSRDFLTFRVPFRVDFATQSIQLYYFGFALSNRSLVSCFRLFRYQSSLTSHLLLPFQHFIIPSLRLLF